MNESKGGGEYIKGERNQLRIDSEARVTAPQSWLPPTSIFRFYS